MTTFHSGQSDHGRHVRKNTNASMFNFTPQIALLICTVAFTKCEKSGAIIFKSRRSRLSLICNFIHRHALPLSQAKVFRLANSSPMLQQSPARRSRDGRELSRKTPGEMSRFIFAHLRGNGRVVATAMPPSVRLGDSQDNLPYAEHGHAMDASEACETNRSMVAQQCVAVCATDNATSRDRLVELSPSTFSHDIQRL